MKSWILILFVFFCSCQPVKKTAGLGEQVQWEKIGPGGGGATFIPTFSYRTPEEFIVRCDMTGAYLSTDGGGTYSQSNFPNGSNSFAFDPHQPNTIYIGATSLNRSLDGGKSWEQLFPTKADTRGEEYKGDHASFRIKVDPASIYNTESPTVSRIRVDPVNPGVFYFSMGNAFYYSTDNGSTFKRLDLGYPVDFIYTNAGNLKDDVLIFTTNSIGTFHKASGTIDETQLPPAMTPAFSFTAGTIKDSEQVVMYALHHDQSKTIQEEFGYTELWTSNDNGKSWIKINDATINNDQFKIKPSYSMVACSEFDAANAYVVCNRYEEKDNEKSVHWYGALKTGDTGKTWAWVWKGGGGSGQYGVKDGVGVANLSDAWVESAFGGEYIRLMDVGVSPQDGNVAVVTDWYRTMKTSDGGKQWQEVYSKKEADGTYNTRGLDVTTAYGVHFDPFDSSHIAISYTDIGYHHSFNGGKTWSRSMTGIPAEWQNTCYWMAFDPEVKNKIWSVWSNLHDFPRGKMTRDPKWKDRARGGVAVSTDGGKTWTVSNEGLGDNSSTTSILVDPGSPAGNRTLYATVYNKGVFKSNDDGKTWTLKNKGIRENTCAFEITLTPNGTLFLVVSPTPVHKDGKQGKEFYPGDVYKSTDGAETWTRVHVTDKPLIFPNGIEYDVDDPNRIYLAAWSDITLSDLVGRAAAKTAGGDGIIKSEGGIFRSDDNGTTWTPVLDRDLYVYDVTADRNHKGRLYCNTFNGAALRSDDFGNSWQKVKGYDFHWGQRVVVDQNDPDKIFITTFGSSVWHGKPFVENDQWSFAGAGGGGALFHPSTSPHDPDLTFVSCDMTGSYVTENGGKSWRMFNLRGVTDFFVFDPTDPNVIYANSSALYRTEDRGHTWKVVYPDASIITGVVSKGDHAMETIVTTDHLQRKVIALAVDPSKSEKLYAAVTVGKETGLYVSNDRGKKWTKEKVLEDGALKIAIAPWSPVEERTVYIIGNSTISVKEGGQWHVNKGPAGVKRLTAVSAGYDEKQNKIFIYAMSGKSYFNPDGDQSGIHVTDDGGVTWQNRQSGLLSFQIAGAEAPEFRAIATSERHPEVVYVSYNNLKVHRDTVCIGVAKSIDGGKTWALTWKDRLAPDNIQVASSNMNDGWLNERFGPSWGENPFSLGPDPNNPDLCYGTDFGRAIKTSDGGKQWQQVYTDKSPHGWTSRGLEVTTSYQVAFDPFDNQHSFIATTDIGLMESTDAGKSWMSATKDNGIPDSWANSTYWLLMDPKVKNKMWAAMSGTHDLPRPKMWRRKSINDFKGGIVTSEDGGKTWKSVSADIGEAAVTHILLDSASDPASRVLYACAFGKGVYKSNDGGVTWQKKNNGLPVKEPFAWRMEQRQPDGALFLVVARRSDDGSIGNENDGAVYKSTDGAETWTKVTLPVGTNGPMSLKVDPGNSRTLLLSAWGRAMKGESAPDEGGGIFRSEDDGKTWSAVLSSDQHIHDITHDARTNVFYACGFNSSAYRSEDSGRTWQRINGYNFKWGKRVEPDPRDPGKIFVITFGGGVWYGPAKGDQNALEDIATSVLSYRR